MQNNNTIMDNLTDDDEIEELFHHPKYKQILKKQDIIDNSNIDYYKNWLNLCKILEESLENISYTSKRIALKNKIYQLNYHWKNNLIKLTSIGPSLNYEDNIFCICIKKEILNKIEDSENFYENEFFNLRYKLLKYVTKQILLNNNQKLFLYNDSLVWTKELIFAKLKIIKKKN